MSRPNLHFNIAPANRPQSVAYATTRQIPTFVSWLKSVAEFPSVRSSDNASITLAGSGTTLTDRAASLTEPADSSHCSKLQRSQPKPTNRQDRFPNRCRPAPPRRDRLADGASLTEIPRIHECDLRSGCLRILGL